MELAAPKEARPLLVYLGQDSKWARWLHRRLDQSASLTSQTINGKPNQGLALHVDHAQFAEDGELTPEFSSKADSATALIVLCSPAAAKAASVSRAVTAFKSGGGDRSVVAFIVAGGSADPERETISEAIFKRISDNGNLGDERDTYLKADVRDTGDGQDVSVAKIMATLTGLPVQSLLARSPKAPGLNLAAPGAAAPLKPEVHADNAPPDPVAKAVGPAVPPELQSAIIAFMITSLREIRLAEGHPTGLEDLLSQSRTLLSLAGGQETPKGRLQHFVAVLEMARCHGALNDFSAHLDHALDAGAGLDSLTAEDAGNIDYQQTRAAAFAEAGEAHRHLGDAASAAMCLASAANVLEKLAADPQAPLPVKQELSRVLLKLSGVLRESGRESEAHEKDEAALALLQTLATGNEHNVEVMRELFEAQLRVGETYRQSGDLDAALESDRALIPIAVHLRKGEGVSEIDRQLYAIYTRIGDRLRVKGDLDRSLESYGLALTVAQALHRSQGRGGRWQREIAMSHNRIGNVFGMKGDFTQAEQSYRASLGVAAELAKLDPANAAWKRDLALAHGRVGVVLSHLGFVNDALQMFHEGSGIIRLIQDASQNNGILNEDLAWFENQIAILTRS